MRQKGLKELACTRKEGKVVRQKGKRRNSLGIKEYQGNEGLDRTPTTQNIVRKWTSGVHFELGF
jgi:hypothetical protein